MTDYPRHRPYLNMPDNAERKRKRLQHDRMQSLCALWALQHGYTPGCDFMHMAPDGAKVVLGSGEEATIDFAQFFYGFPPWFVDVENKDGKTVRDVTNPAGVAPSMLEDSAPVQDDGPKGWTCTREGCGKWVDMPPRKARGEEPFNWWFCFECKKLPRPPKRELQRQNDARKHRRIDSMFKIAES